MATHPSILAWRIPRTEEPGGLQSMGSQGVGHLGLSCGIQGLHCIVCGLLLRHTDSLVVLCVVPVVASGGLIAPRHSSRACPGWGRCESPRPKVGMQWASPKRVSFPLTPGAAWIWHHRPQGCPPSAPGRRGWGEWILLAPSVPL